MKLVSILILQHPRCFVDLREERKVEEFMSELVNIAELFGKNVFNESVMRERCV